MKAEDLKNSILQLAMEGKLVPQDPNDEPASVLLEKIMDEKEKLIKEKKIRRNNKESFIFRKNGHFYEKIGKKGEPVCIDDEIPFDIPDSWEWCRFSTLVNFNLGKTPQRKNPLYWDNGIIPWVSISDMNDLGVINETKEFITSEAFNDKFKNIIVPKNTLLMSFKLTIGKISILKIDSVHNEAIISIYPYFNEKFITRNYLFYILPIIAQKGDSKNAIKGKTLNKKSLEKLIIPLPPFFEQKRIIDKIKELLLEINKYDSHKTKLDKLNSEFPNKLKSSILQEAIQGKLVPQNHNDEPASVLLGRIMDEKERLIKEKKIKRNKNESYIFKENNHYYEKIGKNGEPVCIDDEIPFEIPDNWIWCRMNNIIQLISGRDMKKIDFNSENKGIPYITGASNIENNNLIINRWIEKPSVIAIKQDILLTCKGTIGKLIILNEEKAHIARQIMSIRLFTEDLERKYLLLVLKTHVENLKNTARSMIPGVSRENVLNILVPIPPHDEQKKIVKIAEYLFKIFDG